MSDLQTVTELAADLGVTPRAIRFYEKKGLIAPQRVGRTRVYARRDRARLTLILRGKRLGFSLRELKEWIDLYDADPNQIEQVTHLIRKVTDRIAMLEQQRADIEATLKELRQILSEAREHLNEHTLKSA